MKQRQRQLSMKQIPNKIMLITYPDCLGKNLAELEKNLVLYFTGVVKGLHILPFYPSSGDRGFSPITYREVDRAFGSFAEINTLGQHYTLMVDYMVNHISRQSAYFKDFLAKKDKSPWKDLFIRHSEFWPGGKPTKEQAAAIYKRKPREPYIEAEFADGSKEKIWCTFSEEQIDLNPWTRVTQEFNRENIEFLVRNGASIVRLDAFAYATKRAGTNCFFVENDVWELLEEYADNAAQEGAEILPEIHEHYNIQLRLAQRGYWVYDFALPMLVLHALYSGHTERLLHWFEICPRKQFTTLDTHDGIGIVDVKELLSDEEIEFTLNMLYQRGANVKPQYSSAEYNNLDIYQINCTYYSALGNDGPSYLLARAIQFFAPGIPQVYYVGLLAGENDIELLERTKEGRNINRHNYTTEELERETKRPLVKALFALCRFRNTHPAFDGAPETPLADGPSKIVLRWKNGPTWAALRADLAVKDFRIDYSLSDTGAGEIASFSLSTLFNEEQKL
jgi:sucrose phosphorylase